MPNDIDNIIDDNLRNILISNPHVLVPLTNFYVPLNDLVFRLLLLNNPIILVTFLSLVIKNIKFDVENPPVAINSVLALGPDKKVIILDLVLQNYDGTYILIENQRRYYYFNGKRFLFYTTRQHGSQLIQGEAYSDIKDVFFCYNYEL